MKIFSLITFSVVALVLTSCATTTLYSDPDFTSTRQLMKQVRDACDATKDDHQLAQAQCFPLLAYKELTVRVEKVSKLLNDFTIIGSAGEPQNQIQCKLKAKESDKLAANPDLVKVGQKIRVSGKFAHVTLANFLDVYSLSDCAFTN